MCCMIIFMNIVISIIDQLLKRMCCNRIIVNKLFVCRFLHTICFVLLFVNVSGQEKYNVDDIKGIWISKMFYNESKDEYEDLPRENVISFGFTSEKGTLNQDKYKGLYRLISGGMPKMFYYTLENNLIRLFDSTNTPLSYSLIIESVIPNFLMTATLTYSEGDTTSSSKMMFIYYEKKKNITFE